MEKLRRCTIDPIALHVNFVGSWAQSSPYLSFLSLSHWIVEGWRNVRVVELFCYGSVPPDFEDVLAGIASICRELEHLEIRVDMIKDDEARCFSMQVRQACVLFDRCPSFLYCWTDATLPRMRSMTKQMSGTEEKRGQDRRINGLP